MNKYCRGLIHVPFGVMKIAFTKLFHIKNFHVSPICAISPLTEITLDYGGKLEIKKGLKMRDGAKIRVRKGACCKIGKNVGISSNNIIACHDSIIIGNNVQFGPNVLIYDHDHDFRAKGGIGAMKYKTSPVEIGSNVWIGANCVILRGTKIGDNCVVAAGSVIKGAFESNTVIVQKRKTNVNCFKQ